MNLGTNLGVGRQFLNNFTNLSCVEGRGLKHCVIFELMDFMTSCFL
jgi:hypothetical protein